MEIIIGKTAGFCAGVKNAVLKTEEELEKIKGNLYCLGEIVHNKQVVEKLEKKGLKVIDNIEQAQGKTIIRAHGVSKKVYEKAKEKQIEIIDLTCPKVLQIHKIVEEYSQKGYYTILIGMKEHPEVVGTIGFAGKSVSLISDESEIQETIKKVEETKIKKILIIVQTTYHLKKFEEITEKIKSKLSSEYTVEVKNTICTATKSRQMETETIAQNVDYMIIVGGKNSSNTKKLYDIAETNCKKAIWVETARELEVEEIKKISKIGIMAGASTPNEIIEEIKNAIEIGEKR